MARGTEKSRSCPLFWKAFITAMACWSPPELSAETKSISPVPRQAETALDPHWHLFLDDYIIERSTGFRRVVHHPEAHGIVIPADKPWEAQGISPMYVGRRKDGSFECYYRAHGADFQLEATGYAISKDGIHWEKPDLGLIKTPEGQETNLVPTGVPVDLALYGNVSDPNMRFMIPLGDKEDSGWRLRLYVGSSSPDFVNDPDWRDKLVEVGSKPGYKLTVQFWDDVRDEWVAMRQSPNHPPTRAVARWFSKDLRNWTIRPVLYPDASDSTEPSRFDEAYGMRAIYTEGLVLGFIEWFIGDQTRPEYSVLEQELIGRIHMKGPMEVRIAVSRNGGFKWDRTVSREAWIPHGKQPDSYDRCVVSYANPLRMGDEDWFYVYAYNGDHAAGMGFHEGPAPKSQGALYTQKHNRYVSLSTGDIPQILITKPLQVTGKALELNVDASQGEVLVGIATEKELVIPGYAPGIYPNFMVRDRDGNTHLEPGFRLEDCKPVTADSIEHVVQFKDAKIESLLGKTVRLYILSKNAQLYGFRFK